MCQDRPNPSAVDTAQSNAKDLHNLSVFGEKAYPYILTRMGELNTNFKDDPGKSFKRSRICTDSLVRTIPYLTDEVQIAADVH